MKEKIVDNDELLNIVNEIKILIKEDRYNNESVKDIKKFTEGTIILEKPLLKYTGKNDPKMLKTELPDFKWTYFVKK